ncbi:thiol:disulfide interchange protein DsbC [Azomonas agilis]|uniref:Thiol:disulfide interchange protein n=1 Tax=Azomonas agilis TaxID=116849 RepID=A0A562IZZ2_9GAMM|nr:thioredoxin fold domain-containing protein [Azomonas agilis]TWH76467.1 thiol:disulfide interchange protein DsbC [Azomonas agilis]
MSVIRGFWTALALLSCTHLAYADSPSSPEQAIRKTLQSLQSDMVVESISKSPVAGLYQVALQGGRQIYASTDGQFLLQGYLFQYKEGAVVNLTEQAQETAVAKTIAGLSEQEMVVFSPKDPKTTITVFTDTDCPYCQKLHDEVPELNKRGVAVRYLAFPRQGLKSHAAEILESVWCAKDRQKAMDLAKARKEVDKASCSASPIAKQYALGQNIGIQGTPAIILANGQIIPGYQPAAVLADQALKAAKVN